MEILLRNPLRGEVITFLIGGFSNLHECPMSISAMTDQVLNTTGVKKTTVYQNGDWELVAAAICILLGCLGLVLVNNSKLWYQVMERDASISRVGSLTREAGSVRQRSSRG